MQTQISHYFSPARCSLTKTHRCWKASQVWSDCSKIPTNTVYRSTFHSYSFAPALHKHCCPWMDWRTKCTVSAAVVVKGGREGSSTAVVDSGHRRKTAAIIHNGLFVPSSLSDLRSRFIDFWLVQKKIISFYVVLDLSIRTFSSPLHDIWCIHLLT